MRVIQRSAANGKSGFGYLHGSSTACVSPQQRSEIQARIRVNQRRLGRGGAFQSFPFLRVRFSWPLRTNQATPGLFGVHGISNYVDLDSTGPGNLLDYECGVRSYDLFNGYDHSGIDFFTWPFGWSWMDNDVVSVVAVADGTVVDKIDGNPDESCSLQGLPWNAVFVQHDDGSVVWYGHLRRGSVTPKEVGMRVRRGETLGTVGSSGNSTGPHLHLEVYDRLGRLIDPFAGPCNTTTSWSWWHDQRPYFDSAVNRLLVGREPVDFPPCPGRATTNEVSIVNLGTTTYFSAFYRDQLAGQVSNYRLRRPSGTVLSSWDHSSPAEHYAASWWWWAQTLPIDDEIGVWTFEVEFEDQLYVMPFTVNP